MTTANSDQKDAEDGDVIDAEIVAEQEADPVMKDVKQSSLSGKQRMSRTGWYLAALLAVFVGGLYAAPYVRSGLVDAGMLSVVSSNDTTTNDWRAELKELQTRVLINDAALIRQQEMIRQLFERLDAESAARQQINQDIAALSSQRARQIDRTTSAEAITTLRAAISRLDTEVARLAGLSVNASPDVTAIASQLAVARAETSQLKTKIVAMETTLSDLQAGAMNTSPRGRLLVALGRIKEQAASGLGFGADLGVLRLDIAELPALDQQMIGADFAVLTAHESGVLSFERLTNEYGDVARQIKRAQEKDQGGFLAHLFTVRRTDDGAIGIDAILLEVERRMAVRDVAGAVSVLSGLEANAREAAAVWISAAQAHVDTLAAIDRMRRAVSDRAQMSGGQA